MPKLKVSKSVKGRFKVTSSGKILRRMSGQKHLKIHRSSSNKRRGAKTVQLVGAWHSKLKKLLSF